MSAGPMPTTRYSCPVDRCGWSYDEPSLPDPAPVGDRWRLPDPGARVGRVEAVLAAHQQEHTPVEYLRTIMRLERELVEARMAAEADPDAVHRLKAEMLGLDQPEGGR